MSRTSSGSWAARAPPAGDIIDLDRFMRSARPTRAPRDLQLARNGQLVVDGGSLGRAPRSSASSASAPRRDKRFSHDSGLSDGSYARKRHRPHRRVSCADSGARREAAARVGGGSGSSASMRAFRAACERALRDQQQAIARVAQLCQRLGERRDRDCTRDRAGDRDRDRSATDSSDASSSTSTSTRDQRRKDKHRTEECKTYKIIMTKLDELNRLFAARGRSPGAGRVDARAPPADACPPRVDACPGRVDAFPGRTDGRPRDVRRARDSASSVSVSDKLVATDPPPAETVPPAAQAGAKCACVDSWKEASASRLVERAVGSDPRRPARLPARRPERLAALRAAALPRAPPRAHGDCLAESGDVSSCDSGARRGSSAGSSSIAGAPCCFDLDNPVHLYAQAKRLQALHATTHVGGGGGGAGGVRGGAGGAWGGAGGARRAWGGCVRALRHCLAAPLCCPTGWT